MEAGGKIAKVYAEAVLELAKEKGSAAALEEELQGLAHALKSDESVWKFFEAPVLAIEEKLKVIEQFIKPHVDPILFNLLGVLAKRKRMEQLPFIATAYSDLLDKELGRERVHVQIPEKLNDEQLKEIESAMKSYLNADVVMDVEKHPELIGGVIIRAGDLLIDTSLRSSLLRIKSKLLQRKTIGEDYYEN